MPLDLVGAREAGYSDSEIADFLSGQVGFDAASARKSGYSDGDIIGYLSDNEKPLSQGRLKSAGQSFMREGAAGVGRSTSWFGRVLDAMAPYMAGSDPSGFAPSMEASQAAYEETQRRAKLTPAQREAEIQQNPIYQAGQNLTEGAKEAFQANHRFAGEFFADVVPGAAGGMVPTIAAGIVNPALAVAQYSSAAGQSQAEEALAAGSPESAQRAAMMAAPIAGVSEALLGPVARLRGLRRLAQQRGALPAIRNAAVSEAAQEGIEQVGGNLIASTGAGYDPDRPLMQGVPEAMAAGGLLGGLVGGGVAGVNALSNRELQRAADRELAQVMAQGRQLSEERRLQQDRLNQFNQGLAAQQETSAAAERDAILQRARAGLAADQELLAGQIADAREQGQLSAFQAAIAEADRLRIAEENRARARESELLRMTNAERRAAEEAALTAPTPVAPQLEEERPIGQYPPEGMPTGSIPSAEELARREARRLDIAARNKAEADARRAEAAARGEIGAVADLLSEQEELQASRFPAAQRPIGPESAASLLPGNLMERLRAARQQDEQQLQQIQRMAEIVRNAPPQQTPLQMATMLQQRSQSLPPTPSLPRDTGAAPPTGGAGAAPAILRPKASRPKRIRTKTTNANQVKETVEVAGGEQAGPAPRVAEGEAAAVQESAQPQVEERPTPLTTDDARTLIDHATESNLFRDYEKASRSGNRKEIERIEALAANQQQGEQARRSVLALRAALERKNAVRRLNSEAGGMGLRLFNEAAAQTQYEGRVAFRLAQAINTGSDFSMGMEARGVVSNDQKARLAEKRGGGSVITTTDVEGDSDVNLVESVSAPAIPSTSGAEALLRPEIRSTIADVVAANLQAAQDSKGGRPLDNPEIELATKNAVRALIRRFAGARAQAGVRLEDKNKIAESVGLSLAGDITAAYSEGGIPAVREALSERSIKLYAGRTLFTGNRSLSEGRLTLEQAIGTVLQDSPAGSLVRSIAQKLLQAGVNPQVVVLSDADFDALGPNLSRKNALYQTESDTIYVRQSSGAHDYLVMHEAIHAATVYGLRNNPQFLSDILALRTEAQRALGSSSYGLQNRGDNFTDAAEFVAEALSNEEFQAQLKQIRITPTESLWDRFKGLIKRLFGNLTPQETTLLDLVLETTTREFAPNRREPWMFQTKSSEFKRWFGDWENPRANASKVVDGQGRPLRVFHGTKAPDFRAKRGIEAFNENLTRDIGIHFGTTDQANDFVAGGINEELNKQWAGDSQEDSIFYDPARSDRIYAVFLNIRNPLSTPDLYEPSPIKFIEWARRNAVLPEDVASRAEDVFRADNESRIPWTLIRDELVRQGYDGIRYINEKEGRNVDESNVAWIAFSPEQVKSAIGNRGTFFSDYSDILYAGRGPRSADDVVKMLTVPDSESREHIIKLARARKELVPGRVVTEIKDTLLDPAKRQMLEQIEAEADLDKRKQLIEQAKAGGFDYRAYLKSPEAAAEKMLERAFRISEMSDQPGLKLTEMPDGPSKINIAESVDNLASSLRAQRRNSEASMQRLQDKAKDPNDQLNKDLEELKSFNKAIGVTAKGAVSDYDAYLADRRASAELEGESVKQAVLDAGAKATRARANSMAVGKAMSTIAEKLDKPTLDGFKTNEELLQEVVAKGLLAGNELEADLLPSADDPGILGSYKGLLRAVRHLHDLKYNADETAKRITGFQDRFRTAIGSKGKGRVSLPEWLRAYTEWVANLDGLETVSAAIAKRDKRIKALQLKVAGLDKVLNSPEFKDQHNEAVRLIGKMFELVEGELDDRTGDRIYRLMKGDNQPENVFRFKNGLNRRVDMMHNVDEAARGIARINELLARPDIGPETRETLKLMLLKFHQEQQTKPDGSLWYGALDFVRLFRIIPIAKSFVTPNVASWFTAGPLGRALRNIQLAKDRVYKLGENAQANKNYGRNAQLIAENNAVKSHIESGDIPADVVKAGKAHVWWDENILNPLLAANQYYEGFLLDAGQYTEDGYKITPEDVRAARLQVRYKDELYKTNELGGSIGVSPTRISFVDNGEQMLRKSVATGPMTMPMIIDRQATADASEYTLLDVLYRWEQAGTQSAREALLEDPYIFSMLAKKYVGDLTTKLKRNSPFEKAYVDIASEWRNKGTGGGITFSDLIDEIQKRSEPNENESDEEHRDRIVKTLIEEIDRKAQAISKQKVEDDAANKRIIDNAFNADTSVKNNPDGMVLTQLDAENSFTKPRKEPVAPAGWYKYSISPGHAYGALSKAATLKLTMRELDLLRQIEARAKQARQQMTTRSGDWRNVDTRDLGIDKKDQVYTLERLDSLIRLVEVIKENLRDTVTIRPSSAESRTLWSMLLDMNKTMKLSQLPSLGVNTFSGSAYSKWVTDAVLFGNNLKGGWKVATLPLKSLGGAIDVATALATKIPGAQEWMRKNRSKLIPVLSGMVAEMEGVMRVRQILGEEYSSLAQAIEARGIGTDVFNTGYKSESAAVRFVDALGGKPVVRHVTQAMPWIIKKAERATEIMSTMYIDRSLRLYFGLLSKIIKARVEAGAQASLDFNKPENRFTAKELQKVGITPDAWAKTNTLFATTKGIEEIALDYYNATEEARKRGERVELLPFTNDEFIYADIMTRMAGLINMPLRSNRPDIVRARSSFGDVLRGFLFPGWANGWLSTLQLIQSVKADRSFTPAMALGVLGMLTMMSAMLAMGIPLQLLRKFLYEFWYNRPYPVETIADFAREPSTELGMRVAGSAISGSIPYMGEYIASLFGAQNYKSDPTSLVNMHLGLQMVNGLYEATKHLVQTGDVTGTGLALARNFVPSAGPLLARIPDIQARNASSDAVRVARLNRGSIDVPARLQGSNYGGQTSEFGQNINKALAAAAAGDMGRASQLLSKAQELNPGAVRAAIQARRPEYKAFGRRLTDEEKAGLLGRMSSSQRAIYGRADAAVDALLSIAPTKTQTSTTRRPTGAVARINKRLRAVRAASQPKALKAVRSKIRALRPARVSGSSGGRSSLLRPVRQGQAGRLVRPASSRMPMVGA